MTLLIAAAVAFILLVGAATARYFAGLSGLRPADRWTIGIGFLAIQGVFEWVAVRSRPSTAAPEPARPSPG